MKSAKQREKELKKIKEKIEKEDKKPKKIVKEEKSKKQEEKKKTEKKKSNEKKESKIRINPRKRFAHFLEKTGSSLNQSQITGRIFRIAIIINLIISAYIIFYFSTAKEVTITYMLLMIAVVWTLAFAAILMISWLAFYVIVDLNIYKRRIGIEDVLPDFLQLTSANIRAGMPIDRALWQAIRPNFGVLAKEMEDVAKQTMTGTPLETALREFASKYDSPLLKRSMSLLIEGLNAGGEIGELLDRISTNIQESKTMQREMSASVTTYAIFISFACVVAAPFLLALSNQLLYIIQDIIGSIDMPKGTNMMISFSQIGVTPTDFQIFAITTLVITSVLSASIVATIKKGNVQAGAKYIPMFIISTVIFFIILNYILGLFVGTLF